MSIIIKNLLNVTIVIKVAKIQISLKYVYICAVEEENMVVSGQCTCAVPGGLCSGVILEVL